VTGNTEKAVSEEIFWQSIREHEVLDRLEERELILKAQEGDRDAVEKLINSNQRLVAVVARTYYRSPISGNLDFMDLIQVGNLGLIRAIEKFDLRREIKLSTYAIRWIKAKIRRHCLNAGTIMAIPYSRAEHLSRAAVIRNRRYQELEREPTIAEIAEELGEEEVREIEYLLSASDIISIDSTASGESETAKEELMDSGEISTEDSFAASNEIELMLDKMKYLPKDMRRAVYLRYGLDHQGERTLEEIAQELGISRTQCSRLIKRGLTSLKYLLKHDS